MSETTLTSPSTITPLQSMLHELYALLELWKFTAPGGSYSGYTGGFFKLELGGGGTRNVLAFNVGAFAWGSASSAIDFGALGAVRSDASTVEFAANSYFDGTNYRAKATGFGGHLYSSSGALQWDYAASVAAGATQTYVVGWRIDNSGNFTIGNTTTSITPANGVSVVAPLTGTQVAIGHASGTASGTTYVNCAYNAVSIGNITQNGTTAVLYNTTSDVRLKGNVGDAPEAGDIIDAIRVRSFDWTRAQERVTHGFIAQELVGVAPQAVHQGDAGPLTDDSDVWGVDPSKLVALLVKEVQSLRARLAAAGIA